MVVDGLDKLVGLLSLNDSTDLLADQFRKSADCSSRNRRADWPNYEASVTVTSAEQDR